MAKNRGTPLGGPVVRRHAPNVGGLGLIPGQGTTPSMVQLRIHRTKLKVPHATTKTEDPAHPGSAK